MPSEKSNTGDATADVLYGVPPRDPQDEKEMFSTSRALEPAYQNREAELADILGLTTEQRTAERTEFTQTIRTAGLDGYGLGQRLYGLSVDARIAAMRGGDDEDQLERQIQRDNEETRQQLAGLYGREEAEKWLARAQKFVRQHPKLSALLNTRGIGSRADVVMPIVEHIRRINFK